MTDFLNCEKKLITEQLHLINLIKTQETLSKINKILSNTKTNETIICTVKTEESLSVGFKLPLKIKGKMLGVGKHKFKYYSAEELKKSVLANIKPFPVKLDHRFNEVGSTVGAVDKIYYDNMDNCVRYEGHINDETFARNILDKVITEVSATIASEDYADPEFGIVAKNLEYKELSLVTEGAYGSNSLEVA